MDGDDALALADWRRRVSAMYQAARDEAEHDPEAAWSEWRRARDALFAAHPQSPVPLVSRLGFAGLGYFAYDPVWSCPLAPPGNRLEAAVRAGERIPSL